MVVPMRAYRRRTRAAARSPPGLAEGVEPNQPVVSMSWAGATIAEVIDPITKARRHEDGRHEYPCRQLAGHQRHNVAAGR